jgi:hypothetical protein
MDESLKAKFGLDESEFSEGIRRLTAAVGDLSGKMQEFGERANSGFKHGQEGANDFQGAMDNLQDKIIEVFAVEKIIDFGKDCVEAATKADTAFRHLQFSTEKIGGASPAVFKSLIQWTDAYAESLKMLYSPTELQSAEAQLATFGLTTTQIKSLLPQIVDLAQGLGIDLTSATSMATQAIMGHGRALISAGIHIQDTGSKTKNLAELQQKLSKFTGEAASQLDSFANKAKEADNNAEEMEKTIGEGLTPIWQGFRDKVLEATKGILEFFSVAAENKSELSVYAKRSTESLNLLAASNDGAMISMIKAGKTTDEYGRKLEDLENANKNINQVLKERQEIDKASKQPSTEKDFKAQGADATKENEPKNPADHIKDATEIINEGAQAYTIFGKTADQVYKQEQAAIEESMKKLIDKGELTDKEKSQYDELKANLAGVKDAQKQLTDQEEAEKYNNEIFIKQYNDRVKADIDAYEAQIEAAKKASEEKLRIAESEARTVAQITTRGAEEVGSIIADAANSKGNKDVAKKLFGDMAKLVGEAAKKMGEKLIALGAVANVALPGSGTSEMVGGAGMVVAGTALSAIQFASGGIVSGSTFANIGEYAGASHNPEVVAPLDKLKGMIGDTGGGGGYRFEIAGDKLLGIQDRIQNNNQFVMGTNNQ